MCDNRYSCVCIYIRSEVEGGGGGLIARLESLRLVKVLKITVANGPHVGLCAEIYI